MKNIIAKCFKWQPTRETLIAALAGLLVIGLSAAMLPVEKVPWLKILIRDAGQIFLIGILFPLLYIQRSGNQFDNFGLSLRKWYIFLPINLVLGGLLLMMFLSETAPPAGFRPDGWKIAFLLSAGVFEVIFFYCFQRTLFERAFGIVPAIILSALFYAFHHIGFQPEYGSLIFVGIMFATIARLGNSALLIYPFFWGVGASYDVLIQSQAVSPILYPQIRSLYLGSLILVTAFWTWKNRPKEALNSSAQPAVPTLR